MRVWPLLLLFLTGCGHTRPEPTAPTVMTRPQRVECPPPATRAVPDDLLLPLELETPTVLPAGLGDYGLSRGDVEKLVTAIRAAAARQAQWKAWAIPQP